jgi:hypothetical protein
VRSVTTVQGIIATRRMMRNVEEFDVEDLDGLNYAEPASL